MRFFEEINFTLRKLYKKLPCKAKFISFVSASFSSVIKRQFRSRKRQVRTNLVENCKQISPIIAACLAFCLFLFLLLLFAELNRHQTMPKQCQNNEQICRNEAPTCSVADRCIFGPKQTCKPLCKRDRLRTKSAFADTQSHYTFFFYPCFH